MQETRFKRPRNTLTKIKCVNAVVYENNVGAPKIQNKCDRKIGLSIFRFDL